MEMVNVQENTFFNARSGLETLNVLLDLSGYWTLCSKHQEDRARRVTCRSRFLEQVDLTANLLSPRTKLPNSNFLAQLLAACCCKDCRTCFPISLATIEISDYGSVVARFTSVEIERSMNLVIGILKRQIDESCDILIQDSESRFYLISFHSSVSRIAKLMHDVRKSLHGLTVPYPKSNRYADILIDSGIALFQKQSAVDECSDWVQLADSACAWGRETGKTQIAVY